MFCIFSNMKRLIVILFLLPTLLLAQNKVRRYEYWFDNNYSSRVTTNISPVLNFSLNTSIPTSTLSTGLHVIHMRFQDESARWSSTVSQFFQKLPPVISSNFNLVGYEYWFDNNYAAHVYSSTLVQENVNITSAISTPALADGLHVIHIRFKDNSGKWSSTASQFFHKIQSTISIANDIVAYQYWYDNNFTSATFVTVGPSQNVNILSPLSASSLNNGLHVIHFRSKDNTGKWSSTVSQFFQKVQPSNVSAVQLTSYQYWYDNNYGAAVTNPISVAQEITLITSLSASSLADGLHMIHIRFKDNTGKWSSVVSQFFHKTETVPSINNMIVAYRYWFDTNDAAMISNNVAPSADYTLNTIISMITVPHGAHLVNFQFRDSLGMWSSVVTDTVTKLPVPIALFSAADTIFCDSGTVAFSNQSIDADTYLWDFGDLTTSTLQTPIHTYTSPGLYNVSLTVLDTTIGRDSITVYNTFIEVYAIPAHTLTVSSNDSICAGTTANIFAPVNYVYSWNTGSTASSITVNSAGDYFTTITNAQYAGCFTHSDTVHITLMPLPIVNLGIDTNICQGSQLTLNAFNSGATYNWSTSATTSSIVVNAANTFWVNVTSAFGCANIDTITIGINPLPIAAFTYNVSNLTASFTNASNNSTSYSWNFGDAAYSTVAAPSHTYTVDGTYTVTLIASNNCGSDTTFQVISVTGIDGQNAGEASLIVYPNPATNIVNVRYATATDCKVSFSLFDIAGQMVMPIIEQEVRAGYVQTIQLSTTTLANGTYFITMNIDGKKRTNRIVITK